MVTIFADISWRPLFNDHYPLAWLITLTHFVASGLCFSAGRRQLSTLPEKGVLRPEIFWFILGALMAGLGLNKQLDLQTLLTMYGRQVAKAGGWYAHRRFYQSVFVFVCLVIGSGCALGSLFFVRGHWRDRGVAYLGLIFLLTFVAIRAASFHHVDAFLYRFPLVGNWMNAGLELGGALLVIVGAALAHRRKIGA